MKKNRKLISVLIVSLLILFSVNNISITADENTPTFELKVPKTEYDVGDVFEVTLSLKSIAFRMLQAAISFDPEIVKVVDEESQETEDSSKGIIKKRNISGIGNSKIDNAKGLIKHAAIVFLGEQGGSMNYVVSKNGIDYIGIRFKAIKTGNPKIHFVTEDSPEYDPNTLNGYMAGTDNSIETGINLIAPDVKISNTQPTKTGNGEKHIDNNQNNENGLIENKSNSIFNDIEHVEWAREYIEALFELGIISGVGNNRFEPDRNISREEFTKMLIEAFGFEEQDTVTGFSDVDVSAWYYNYVATAKKLGIVNGIGDNKFGIETLISRQDMATMAHRAAQVAGINIPKYKESNVFLDEAEIADYAKEAIKIMQEADIISGMGNNTFAPKENTTRAQAVKIIYMLLSAK